jgi:hypothetical protein
VKHPTAALARAEPGTLGRRGGRIEADVARERRSGRAAGPAVDLGRQHRSDKPAIEPRVLRLNGSVAAVEILMHVSRITPDQRHI